MFATKSKTTGYIAISPLNGETNKTKKKHEEPLLPSNMKEIFPLFYDIYNLPYFFFYPFLVDAHSTNARRR